MKKSWGKEIWEKKAKNQSGQGVSGGTVSVFRGRQVYEKNMKSIQNILTNEFKINRKKIKDILEIGPGPDAINAVYFLEEGYNLDILDISESVLNKVKRKLNNKKSQFFQGDLIEFKISKKYDLIFCLGTFLHIPQHLSLKVMDNLGDHIKKEGYLIIDFPIKKEMTLKQALWQGAYFFGHRIKKRFSRGFYVTCASYSLEEVEDILKRTKFKPIMKKKGMWLLKKIN